MNEGVGDCLVRGELLIEESALVIAPLTDVVDLMVDV